ncbi:hypothetical protein HUK84_00935 [Nguyenibacter vanlangensis]|uniref:Uncharacterized protein n=1 Tax=Nguyenibacter vanlangensis TaxID=1216886 RepID=A0A7Y7M488_9PROT|nr:hypothetical protein [Nguyenibacter vanlangensis]
MLVEGQILGKNRRFLPFYGGDPCDFGKVRTRWPYTASPAMESAENCRLWVAGWAISPGISPRRYAWIWAKENPAGAGLFVIRISFAAHRALEAPLVSTA